MTEASDPVRHFFDQSSVKHYRVSLDELLERIDVFKPHDYTVFSDWFEYVLKYSDGSRQVQVRVQYSGNNYVRVGLLETEKTFLPKASSKFAVRSLSLRAFLLPVAEWKPWVSERRAVVYVRRAECPEELVDAALEAAEMLNVQYRRVYLEELRYAPLEDMILTGLLKWSHF